MRSTLLVIGMTLSAPAAMASEVTTSLQLEAHDDGLPSTGMQYRWSVLSAPPLGRVRFVPSAEEPEPQVALDVPGTYRFEIAVDDGHLRSTASVEIVVLASSTDNAVDKATTADPGSGCGGGSALAVLLASLGLLGSLRRRASAVPDPGTSPRP